MEVGLGSQKQLSNTILLVSEVISLAQHQTLNSWLFSDLSIQLVQRPASSSLPQLEREANIEYSKAFYIEQLIEGLFNILRVYDQVCMDISSVFVLNLGLLLRAKSLISVFYVMIGFTILFYVQSRLYSKGISYKYMDGDYWHFGFGLTDEYTNSEIQSDQLALLVLFKVYLIFIVLCSSYSFSCFSYERCVFYLEDQGQFYS